MKKFLFALTVLAFAAGSPLALADDAAECTDDEGNAVECPAEGDALNGTSYIFADDGADEDEDAAEDTSGEG